MEDTFFHHLDEVNRATATNLQPLANGPNFPTDTFLEDDHYIASNEYELWQNDYNGSAYDQTSYFAENERTAEQHCLSSLEQHVLTSADYFTDQHDHYEYDDRARQAARGEARLTLPPRSSRSNSALIAMTNSTRMPNRSGVAFRSTF